MAYVCEGLLQGVDEQTADLIIQLQLQDADRYSSSSKGKAREDEVSDESLAFQLQVQELESISSLRTDNRMARSMACAVQADGQLLTETLSQEEIATRDRGIARQLTDGVDPSNMDYPEGDTEAQFFDDELLEKLRVLYVSNLDDGPQDLVGGELDFAEGGQAESSAWAASRTINPSPINRRCEACREERKFFDVARVPCRHEYCRACLEDLFEASMTDESLFPPRCCRQPITVASVRVFLKSELVRGYEKKKVEFVTPNRTYCYSSRCSAFIDARYISGEVATCLECGSTTCTTCKAAAHEGDCPNDTLLQQVLDTARENGWQRCYSCWRVVELDHGCNHMTCRCGAQFCYVCGQRWKSCTCEQWDEHRLLARANQILDREPERLAEVPAALLDAPQPLADPQPPQEIQLHANPAPTARDVLVAETIQNLRENHECDHSYWRWVRGPHQCEECYHFLKQYIFECRQCRLQACNRCRRNRL